MKLPNILPILSIIFAVALSLSAVAVLGEPANAAPAPLSAEKSAEISVIGIAKAEKTPAALDLDKIEELINKNRVFDDFIYDTAALVDGAKFVLRDEAETVDGKQVIKCSTVNDFVAELYGRKAAGSQAEYYPINDHGYTELTQHIVSAVTNTDGTVTVTSCLNCGDDCEATTVITTLSPADNSYGYIICYAKIVE